MKKLSTLFIFITSIFNLTNTVISCGQVWRTEEENIVDKIEKTLKPYQVPLNGKNVFNLTNEDSRILFDFLKNQNNIEKRAIPLQIEDMSFKLEHIEPTEIKVNDGFLQSKEKFPDRKESFAIESFEKISEEIIQATISMNVADNLENLSNGHQTVDDKPSQIDKTFSKFFEVTYLRPDNYKKYSTKLALHINFIDLIYSEESFINGDMLFNKNRDAAFGDLILSTKASEYFLEKRKLLLDSKKPKDITKIIQKTDLEEIIRETYLNKIFNGEEVEIGNFASKDELSNYLQYIFLQNNIFEEYIDINIKDEYVIISSKDFTKYTGSVKLNYILSDFTDTNLKEIEIIDKNVPNLHEIFLKIQKLNPKGVLGNLTEQDIKLISVSDSEAEIASANEFKYFGSVTVSYSFIWDSEYNKNMNNITDKEEQIDGFEDYSNSYFFIKSSEIYKSMIAFNIIDFDNLEPELTEYIFKINDIQDESIIWEFSIVKIKIQTTIEVFDVSWIGNMVFQYELYKEESINKPIEIQSIIPDTTFEFRIFNN